MSLRRKPVVNDEEYLKYLMFLSEAVKAEEQSYDPETTVPQLSTLITKAKDATLRPYYQRVGETGLHYFLEGDLPPISPVRQTPVKLPYIEPAPRAYSRV